MDSRGDPRVHLVINATLSTLFAYALVLGYAFVGGPALTWRRVAVVALLLMALTYVVTR
jgi:hypothetical protein